MQCRQLCKVRLPGALAFLSDRLSLYGDSSLIPWPKATEAALPCGSAESRERAVGPECPGQDGYWG